MGCRLKAQVIYSPLSTAESQSPSAATHLASPLSLAYGGHSQISPSITLLAAEVRIKRRNDEARDRLEANARWRRKPWRHTSRTESFWLISSNTFASYHLTGLSAIFHRAARRDVAFRRRKAFTPHSLSHNEMPGNLVSFKRYQHRNCENKLAQSITVAKSSHFAISVLIARGDMNFKE